MSQLNLIAELLLHSHRQMGYRSFLMTSAVSGEGVEESSEELLQALTARYEGDIFLYNPGKLVDGKALKPDDMLRTDFLQELRQKYALVLIVVPDLTESGDAISYLTDVDAVILTVKACATRKRQLVACTEQIEAAELPLIATVLTGKQNPFPRLLYPLLKGWLQ